MFYLIHSWLGRNGGYKIPYHRINYACQMKVASCNGKNQQQFFVFLSTKTTNNRSKLLIDVQCKPINTSDNLDTYALIERCTLNARLYIEMGTYIFITSNDLSIYIYLY